MLFDVAKISLLQTGEESRKLLILYPSPAYYRM